MRTNERKMRREDDYPALQAWRWLVREVKSTRYGGEECGLSWSG